jgi:hypothetical protein
MTDARRFPPTPPDDAAILEARLRQAARDFAYPPTPDLVRAVSARTVGAGAAPGRSAAPRRVTARARLLLAGALLALLLAVALAVPPVRAAVLDWIRVGAVRIFLVQPAPTPTPTPAPGTAAPRATPFPTATPLVSVLNLAGETTLADAQADAGFDLRLPAALGAPDRVFTQHVDGSIVILVWLDPGRAGSVQHALFETNTDSMAFQKITPKKIADTSVSGQPAVWVEGPYLLNTGSGDMTITRLVNAGHTLVWTADGITYRLETGVALEEAVRIAESLR